MTCALSSPYNLSLVNFFMVPQPSQMMAQGWTSLPVDFGEAVLNEPSLMLGFLIRTLPQTTSQFPPTTESMRTKKNVPMNNASVRLSMVPSPPLFYHPLLQEDCLLVSIKTLPTVLQHHGLAEMYPLLLLSPFHHPMHPGIPLDATRCNKTIAAPS